MNKTNICSPPVSSEERQFNIPGGDPEDTFFTFNFHIQKVGTKNDIVFTLDLNPSLCANREVSSPPKEPETETYTFDANQRCILEHQTDEGYYVSGTIEIISFNNPIGQFDDNYKNFLFKIRTGHINNTPHDISGLFGLIDPSSPNPD